MPVSVVDPVSPAIAWTKRVLFRPFDLVKWLAVGFCAWLAALGEGGANFRVNLPSNRSGPSGRDIEEWINEYTVEVVLIVVGLVLLGLGLWLLFTWLSSRGKFMFLDNVARNRAEIREPWGLFRSEGNSLFWFRVAFGLIAGLVILIVAGAALLMLYPSFRAEDLQPLGMVGLAAGIPLILILVVIYACIALFLEDFVVPIMYLRRWRVMDAWREFWSLLTGNAGTFVLYVLFKIVMGICIGVIALVITCITCCLAALPYVGMVILLPLFVFGRSYSLYFLAQFRPEYGLLPDDPEYLDEPMPGARERA